MRRAGDGQRGAYTFVGVLPSFIMLPLPKRKFTSLSTASSALACEVHKQTQRTVIHNR